jgi:hypothetical protein
MFTKNLKLKKLTTLVFSFALLGFFACVFHITPNLDHHNNDNSTKIACVDHQISISSHKDHTLDLAFIDVPPLNLSVILLPLLEGERTGNLKSFDSPPDKIALYIKHETLLL